MGVQKTVRTVRNANYKIARFLGDVNAILSGPAAIYKRFVRKRLLTAAGRGTMGIVPSLKLKPRRRRRRLGK